MIKVLRCFRPLFYIHIEQKKLKYGLSPLNTSHKIPDIFLTYS